MKLSQFKFKLPEEQIALYPTHHRDESRLMVLHKKSGEVSCHCPCSGIDEAEEYQYACLLGQP